MTRAHYIGAPKFFLLNQACLVLEHAFPNSLGAFLVGSSLERRDYRDVDVRVILRDDDFERMFPGLKANEGARWRHAFWSLLCSSVSLHLSRASGLPVDFQVQSQTEANTEYPSPEHKRNALMVGLFLASP